MTALTLTPQPVTASVLIQITGAPAGAVVISRTDINGTGTVRLRSGQLPIAGALTVTDYEAALTGLVRYDVVDTAPATTTASTTLEGLVSGAQISGVQEPQLNYQPAIVTGYDASRDTGSAVLRVLGRPDPVIVLAPTRTREGKLEIWATDSASAFEAGRVLAAARVLMLRQPDQPGMDMYFLAQRIDTTPLQRVVGGWRWQTTCTYVELRNPTLPLLGAAGWTYNDVVTTYPTYAAVRTRFATFNDLLVGP